MRGVRTQLQLLEFVWRAMRMNLGTGLRSSQSANNHPKHTVIRCRSCDTHCAVKPENESSTHPGVPGLLLFLYSAMGLAHHASAASSMAPPTPAAATRPNVVIILADDLGYGDIGAYGATRIRTPHIDALARDGLRFTHGYASANVCSPSRAGLLTGRYAIRSGLAWKVVEANDERGLPESEETLGEIAKRAGYATQYIGKWHLGNLKKYSPLNQGFDHFYGVPHSNDMPDFALYDDNREIERPVDQATLTQRYTAAAVEFIGRNVHRPFLLFVSHTSPHIPLHASPRFHGVSAAGQYGDVVEELDWSTGQIIASLRDAGVIGRTLIIFTSDNGPFFEGSTAGLKGGKGNSWEGGYRVPFIASWPDAIPSGRIVDAMIMNIDVLPTVAAALGVRPAATQIDGRNLLPLARSDSQVHDYLYFFNNEEIVALRSPSWKLVTHAYYLGSLGAFEKFDRLPGFDSPYDLLFDARGVDGEAYSLADRKPRELQQLRAELERARREFAPLRTRPADRTYPE
jgi:arylsulfatase A